MDKEHLLWIVPLLLFIGYVIGYSVYSNQTADLGIICQQLGFT